MIVKLFSIIILVTIMSCSYPNVRSTIDTNEISSEVKAEPIFVSLDLEPMRYAQ